MYTLTQAIQRAPASPHVRLFLRAPSKSIPLSPLYRPANSFISSSLHLRTMSSAPAKHEFLCILPDFPGAQEKRLAVRPDHLAGVKPLVEAGSVVSGGAMLASHPAEGEVPSFKGSMLLAVAENEAAVRAILENDIYARSGVWDMEKAQVIPFKSAVRTQL
ncbi:hypothetical protein N7494_000421 [Penicillium frequentans]|uniref:YCII-related domain-containing protein n=1 Tax=Penicillium frequentans TaxID=3151616 RepID=A0AAD6D5Z9_9EURO|nr:hypothetical protein N7494_000421 [Penicillium glabrum]